MYAKKLNSLLGNNDSSGISVLSDYTQSLKKSLNSISTAQESEMESYQSVVTDNNVNHYVQATKATTGFILTLLQQMLR